jgi:hypothetical protein
MVELKHSLKHCEEMEWNFNLWILRRKMMMAY